MRDTDKEYWESYNELQRTKHSILRKYLGAWFPILTSWSGRVLYIDCHAGRGRHKTGEEGSPIIALNCLLNHRGRAKILARAEITFLFFENKESNAEVLKEEINALGQLPSGVHCELICDDYEKQLSEGLDSLEEKGAELPPSFAFVDPYTFRISMNLLNRLLNFSACELFINFMYRYIDMAVHNPQPAQIVNMDNLFGTSEWRNLPKIGDYDERLSQTVQLFSRQLNAKYVTHMIMRGTNNAVKYVLLHATNNRRGREKMKEAIWSVIPDGSFTAYERDNPDQLVLIGPKPNLKPLEDVMWGKFRGRKVRLGMKQTDELAFDTLYLPKHVREVLKNYRKMNIVKATDYGAKFAFKNNPLFEFPHKRP